MKRKRLLALGLALVLSLSLAACSRGEGEATPTPGGGVTPTPTDAVTPTPTGGEGPTPTSGQEGEGVRVLMLKGPTGLGAAKLMADNDAGTAAQRYAFTVDADPSAVPAKLASGEVDIAALPTNVAANLYNKNGGIRMLALNTLGVLYLLERGESVHSMGDLAGKTLYATGQGANPEYVLRFLLEQSGLDPDADVTIQWRATADEVSTLMAAREAELCMLPVPAATGLLRKDSAVRAAVDLTEAWSQSVTDGSTLTMGCMVARAEFLEENPEAVETFLTEYAASIEYMKENAGSPSDSESPAALAAQYGIVPSAEVAADAIPQANLVCVTGVNMIQSIQGYYQVLWRADSASIGGSLPDDGFYYVP